MFIAGNNKRGVAPLIKSIPPAGAGGKPHRGQGDIMKTNEMTIEQRLDFIASLELPEVSADMEAVERAPVAEGEPSAAIDAAELLRTRAEIT